MFPLNIFLLLKADVLENIDVALRTNTSALLELCWRI